MCLLLKRTIFGGAYKLKYYCWQKRWQLRLFCKVCFVCRLCVPCKCALMCVRCLRKLLVCVQLILVEHYTQRFAAWRSGGFLAQKFNRRTALEPTTKLSYEALNPPLRQTAVSCCPSSLSWLFVVILCLSWCVGLVALLLFLFGFMRLQKSKCATKMRWH